MGSGPITPLPIRASDTDRAKTERALRDRAVDGQLSIDTLARRLELVHQARNLEQLADLERDLPRRGLATRIVSRTTTFVSTLVREVELAWNRPRTPQLSLARHTGDITLGRSRHCGYRLEDPRVSARHAALRKSAQGEWILEDLRSLNGTRLNGLFILGPTPVHPGDVIGVGRSHLRLS
jgi:hypothetical protein